MELATLANSIGNLVAEQRIPEGLTSRLENPYAQLNADLAGALIFEGYTNNSYKIDLMDYPVPDVPSEVLQPTSTDADPYASPMPTRTNAGNSSPPAHLTLSPLVPTSGTEKPSVFHPAVNKVLRLVRSLISNMNWDSFLSTDDDVMRTILKVHKAVFRDQDDAQLRNLLKNFREYNESNAKIESLLNTDRIQAIEEMSRTYNEEYRQQVYHVNELWRRVKQTKVAIDLYLGSP